jgi:hypothetical protein
VGFAAEPVEVTVEGRSVDVTIYIVTVETFPLILGLTDLRRLRLNIGLSGIMPDPRKVSAVHRAAPPATKKILQSFLGTASYLHRFVPGFAAIVSPYTTY